MEQKIKQRFTFLGSLLAAIIIIEVINFFTARSLNYLGLLPRTLSGLTGVITAPFLHGSLWHFFSNIIPLAILGFILSLHGYRNLVLSFVSIVLISGILVWLFGRSNYHIGASGLVFGWWAFLLALGYFQRDWKAILTAIVVFIFYGGLLFSLFSFRSYISFEYHFFGVIAGILSAWFLARKKA
ncbi:rhomboid family intramembrane serine protease [Algibacillus agarilyticus]|uniref:rhomboid family intramembrane serine protease n=1 Tax=Algibacillus agarilyticus TaxID=2234133 RepID=UPI000DD01CB8|nr:rhomboid family intramembrane serine protease [Algibacillus agarilyticus]